jgi:hypothetical protein
VLCVLDVGFVRCKHTHTHTQHNATHGCVVVVVVVVVVVDIDGWLARRVDKFKFVRVAVPCCGVIP